MQLSRRLKEYVVLPRLVCVLYSVMSSISLTGVKLSYWLWIYFVYSNLNSQNHGKQLSSEQTLPEARDCCLTDTKQNSPAWGYIEKQFIPL